MRLHCLQQRQCLLVSLKLVYVEAQDALGWRAELCTPFTGVPRGHVSTGLLTRATTPFVRRQLE